MLSKQHKHVRDDEILFDPIPHKYTLKKHPEIHFKSVTGIISSIFKKFDADKIIKNMTKSLNWKSSKYYGMEPVEIKKLWNRNGKEARELGTKLHNEIEMYYNNIPIDIEENYKEFYQFKKFDEDFFDELTPYRTEWMIWDSTLKIAGSIDMVFENNDGTLSIYDWKRCKEFKTRNSYDYCIVPELNHIPDTNYWHYALQLNLYKYILEHNYNKIVNDLYLIQLHPDIDTYKRVQVPILKNEIKCLIQYIQNNI